MTAPTAEAQVAFLGNLQRLLAEGSFVATHKYALLLALADLSVERGDDSGAPLTLPVNAIAEKLCGRYWRQAVPYRRRDDGQGLAARVPPAVLQQGTGEQTPFVALVAEARATSSGSLPTFQRRAPDWKALVADAGRVVRSMPLWKLQVVGGGVLDFLYPQREGGDDVTLNPGVAFCFRRFHGLVEDLVRGAWVRFVRGLKENQRLLGDVQGLDEFLFGSERAEPSPLRPVLHGLQGGKCFYCLKGLTQDAALDRFVPWARYPVDLGHNFVLAHAKCHGKKADLLAAPVHLARWAERNVHSAMALSDGFAAAEVVADLGASERVVAWAYAQVQQNGGLVWVGGEELVALDPAWAAAA